LKNWIGLKPKSITAHVALAQSLIDFGWEARGNGYADSVSDQQWKLFFGRLQDATAVLRNAASLEEKCPCWWSYLIKAELGLQSDRAVSDKTFYSAVKAWPDYTKFYFKRAEYLLPRWNGTEGELAKEMENSAARIGGDEGDIAYVQTIWYCRIIPPMC
jgi:hypothetical protein